MAMVRDVYRDALQFLGKLENNAEEQLLTSAASKVAAELASRIQG